MGHPARVAAHRRRLGHHRHVLQDGERRNQGVLDYLHQSRCQRCQPEDSAGGFGKRRIGDRPGRLLRDRNQRIRRRVIAGQPVDRVRRRDDQLRAQPDAVPARRRGTRSGAAGLADHRPDRLRDGLFGLIQLRLRRGGIRRDQAVLEPGDGLRPTRGQLPAATPDPSAMALPAQQNRRSQPDPLPQRRCQSEPVDPRGRQHPAAGVPHPKWSCGVLRPPALAARGNARRRLSLPAQHRSPSASVAHADQDRQGRQAQQAQPGAVYRDPSRRRRPASDLRRRPDRNRFSPWPCRAARGHHRPGPSR